MFLSRVPRAAVLTARSAANAAALSKRSLLALPPAIARRTCPPCTQSTQVRHLRTTRPRLLDTPPGSAATTATSPTPTPTPAKPTISTTPLHALHLAHNAKMVPFAGYSMPLMYPPQTHISEHKFTREHASIFDVSHMVQHLFSGPGALAFLESLTPADLGSMSPFTSTLSVFLAHPTGGIVDDTIITMQASQEQFYVVTNAGCREKDLEYFAEALRKWDDTTTGGEVIHEVLEGWGLIALQGPEAKNVLADYFQHVLPPGKPVDLNTVLFGTSFEVSVPASERVGERVTLHVARGGYTGEDGFEISIPPVPTVTDSKIPRPTAAEREGQAGNPTTYITNMLLNIGGKERVQFAGLAARDSLRLEAGMCLYGHDLNEDITPPEASLAWVVHPRRRADALFPGGAIVQQQLAKGGTPPARKRVGLDLGTGGPPAREGMRLVTGEGEEVGVVTSGGPAISLGMKNIAMGYVRRGCDKVGTEVKVEVRGKLRDAKVVKMPFVQTRYWKGDKNAVVEKSKREREERAKVD